MQHSTTVETRSIHPAAIPVAQPLSLKDQLQARLPFSVDAVLCAKPDGKRNPYWTATLQAFWAILQEDGYAD
jgi:hypothetical protein